MKRSPAALLSCFALAAAAWPAHAAPARDEALARKFLFCANVAHYWAQVLSAGLDTSHVADQLKIRDLFVIAAEYVTEPAFGEKAQPAANLSVRTLLSRQKAEQRDLMTPETKACSEIFRTQAQPLLEQRAAEMEAAASAPAPSAPTAPSAPSQSPAR